MRSFLPLLLLGALLFSQASAVVDPHPDGIGVYFDLNADIYEISVPPTIPFSAYVILTNPSEAEIMGYEFSAPRVVPPGMEGMVFVLQEIWLGWNDIMPVLPPEMGDNFMIGGLAPITTSPAMVLVSWQFMLLAPLVMDFYIGPTTGEFGTNNRLGYETPAGWVPLHVSSGDPSLPVATVNGSGVVPVSDVSFGSLKALYR